MTVKATAGLGPEDFGRRAPALYMGCEGGMATSTAGLMIMRTAKVANGPSAGAAERRDQSAIDFAYMGPHHTLEATWGHVGGFRVSGFHSTLVGERQGFQETGAATWPDRPDGQA